MASFYCDDRQLDYELSRYFLTVSGPMPDILFVHVFIICKKDYAC